ncbi:MAG: carboxymuconolactone decarboxylase family protein [Bacteroidia bacterium]
MENNKRKSIKELDSTAYDAMLNLENWSKNCELPALQKELIKIRASQINGCAYCLDMHTEIAIKLGETPRRLLAVSVWHESHLFTSEERVLLKLTEEITQINNNGLSQETYLNSINCFGEKLTAQIIMIITTINAWNRILVSTKQIYKK